MLLAAFRNIAEVGEESEPLEIEGRVVPYRHRAGGVIWLDFDVICGWGRSQHDYLELARHFHTVMVSNVPRIGLSRANEGRRFTLMVDVLYDNRVKLIVSAADLPQNLLLAEDAARDAQIRAMRFEFDRTASRLIEMQSREYLAEERRTGWGREAPAGT
jgi:cell division protein ZapE